MRTHRQIVAAFCSVLSLFGQTGFAYQGGDIQPQIQKLGKAVGIVRMENGKAVCVKAAEGYGFIQNEVPVCSDEQAEVALNVAQVGVSTQTAWLTHAGVFVGGCLYGGLTAMAGMGVESMARADNRGTHVGALAGPAVLGSAGATFLYAVGDPSGHILAGAAGVVVCAGIFNYLLYKEISSKK